MNGSLWRFIQWEWQERRRRKPLISLLVPLRVDDSPGGRHRDRSWKWLKEYWEFHLPEAEIIVADDNRRGVFSKTHAFNRAYRKSHGDILVLLDADAYYDAEAIRNCAHQIRSALRRGYHEWCIPYRNMYRLNEGATKWLLDTYSPEAPIPFLYPPNPKDIDQIDKSGYGKTFGALTMILPWQAIETANRFDERFRGWGGEDVCFMRAVDLLWGRHHAYRGAAFHLWHGNIGDDYDTRAWAGQSQSRANNTHSLAYRQSMHDVGKMERVIKGNRRYFRR